MKNLRERFRKWRLERAEKDAQKIVSQENWGNQIHLGKHSGGHGPGAT